TKIKGKKIYNAAQFKEIMNMSGDLERLLNIFTRKGFDFEEYIKNQDKKTKGYPKYLLKVEGIPRFVLDDKELAKLTKDDEEANFVEILEKADFDLIESGFSKCDLSLNEFLKVDIVEEITLKGENKKAKEKVDEAVLKPVFSVEEEKDKHEFFSLQEVLDFVRVQAKKGIYVQRYKGLGEMNPEQLWETTMDPAKRTILKVSLEDEVVVEEMFSVLMGDEVAPRRDFIKKHAHEVGDLDV
ncbi:MAG: DNA gyrase subunit B, partial [Candidatus Omnitrophota bacterium]